MAVAYVFVMSGVTCQRAERPAPRRERPRVEYAAAVRRTRVVTIVRTDAPVEPVTVMSAMAPALFPSRLRIGLLGGSFNPAHDGHRHISLVALRQLQLDRVIWLVSPQNPLKASDDMADLPARLDRARRVAAHPGIEVSDIEYHLGTQFTADTLRALCGRNPATRFVWLMGADNMVQLPHWDRWEKIPETLPMAVIDRPGYGLKARLGKAAQRYARSRLRDHEAPDLAFRTPPAWIYIHSKLHPLSASAIRRGLPPGTRWTDAQFDDEGS